MEGNLSDRRLAEVLKSLGSRATTGILTVQGEREIIALSLDRGGIVAADALNQSLEDGLGRVLVKMRLVEPEVFAGLAAEYQSGGGRVVDLLVERGFVGRDKLLEALRTHTYGLCLQVLGWSEGDYKFYQGDEVSYEEGMQPISVEELLVRSSRDLERDRPLAGELPELTAVFGRRAAAFEGPTGTRGGELQPALGDQGDLDPVAVRVFALIDSRRTLSQIAAAAGVSEYKVVHLVHGWLAAGLVEGVAPEAPAAAEPAPATERAPAVRAPRKARRAFRWSLPRWKGRDTADLDTWVPRLLGVGLALALLVLFALRPGRLADPLSWLPGEGEGPGDGGYGTALVQVERAAGTFFLLEGRFPDDLGQLVEVGLLTPRALEGPGGRRPQYSATAASYVLQAGGDSGPFPEALLTDTITGNFLLDPEFAVPEPTSLPPLVLLD